MSEDNPDHVRYTIKDSQEEIWLEPQCAEHSYEGRTWAHNCAWDEKCGECGSPPVKYRRADLCLSDLHVEALVEAARDMLAGWQYIRHQHGDLYGVGWDRAEAAVFAALAAMEE